MHWWAGEKDRRWAGQRIAHVEREHDTCLSSPMVVRVRAGSEKRERIVLAESHEGVMDKKEAENSPRSSGFTSGGWWFSGFFSERIGMRGQ